MSLKHDVGVLPRWEVKISPVRRAFGGLDMQNALTDVARTLSLGQIGLGAQKGLRNLRKFPSVIQNSNLASELVEKVSQY